MPRKIAAFNLLLSAGILDITVSTGILGPLAGLIIAYYALQTKGKQAAPALIINAVIAIIAMDITWPYLWPNPPVRLFESFQVMSQYPWKGQDLFNGN